MATTDGAAKLSTVERVVKSEYIVLDCCVCGLVVSDDVAADSLALYHCAE